VRGRPARMRAGGARTAQARRGSPKTAPCESAHLRVAPGARASRPHARRRRAHRAGTPGLPQKSPPVRFLQPLAPTQGGRGVWASCCPTGGVRGEEAPENAHAVRGFSPGDATRCTHPWRVQRGQRDGRRAAGRGRHGSGNPSAPWSGVVHRRPDGDACAGHAAGGYDRRSGAAVAARVRPGKNGIRICASSRITCGRFERARARRCAAVESSADHGRRVCQLRLPDDCAHQGVRSPSTSRC
jgi:hypothetical protein